MELSNPKVEGISKLSPSVTGKECLPLVLAANDLQFDHLHQLITGQVSCIIIDDFYPVEAGSIIAGNVEHEGLTYSFKGSNVSALLIISLW